MAKRGSPAVIGGFVVGAIVLVIAGALALGAGNWLSRDLNFVLNFREAVTGLVVGSPVEFRGVKVGEVKEIRALFEPKGNAFYFPVQIIIEPNRFERLGPGGKDMSNYEVTTALIEKGLRARLETQSFVTGQKRVALDFFPDKVPDYVGPPMAQDLIELPTVPSQTEDIANLFRQIPFERLGRDLVQVVEGLKGLVGPGTDGTVRPLSDLVANLQGTIASVERELAPLLKDGRATLGSVRQVLERGNATIATAESSLKSIGGAAASFEQTSTEARVAILEAQTAFKQAAAGMERARAAITNVEQLTGEDSGVMHEITRAARELGSAGRAVRLLAEELHARPDALVRGKPKEPRENSR